MYSSMYYMYPCIPCTPYRRQYDCFFFERGGVTDQLCHTYTFILGISAIHILLPITNPPSPPPFTDPPPSYPLRPSLACRNWRRNCAVAPAITQFIVSFQLSELLAQHVIGLHVFIMAPQFNKQHRSKSDWKILECRLILEMNSQQSKNPTLLSIDFFYTRRGVQTTFTGSPSYTYRHWNPNLPFPSSPCSPPTSASTSLGAARQSPSRTVIAYSATVLIFYHELTFSCPIVPVWLPRRTVACLQFPIWSVCVLRESWMASIEWGMIQKTLKMRMEGRRDREGRNQGRREDQRKRRASNAEICGIAYGRKIKVVLSHSSFHKSMKPKTTFSLILSGSPSTTIICSITQTSVDRIECVLLQLLYSKRMKPQPTHNKIGDFPLIWWFRTSKCGRSVILLLPSFSLSASSSICTTSISSSSISSFNPFSSSNNNNNNITTEAQGHFN